MLFRVSRALLLLPLILPGIGQNEEEPYFSLSSNRTFGSNSKPSIAMTAWNVDSMEFRVYRVNDPVKFFTQLEDPHQFGGRVPRPTHSPTLLERLHSWKHDLRTNLRREMRSQFTESPSQHFESVLPGSGQKQTKGTQYAEAPILNSQQLVLTFVQPVHSTTRWESENVDIGVKEKGVYLVEAVHKEICAYTILMVSDIVAITKTARGDLTAFIADRKSGEPVPGASIYAITREAAGHPVETDSDGMAEIKAPAKTDDVRIVVRHGADYAVNALSSYAFGSDRDRTVGYIYTDRPVYRPGHTVHFKGIMRLRAAVGYEVPANKAVQVRINDPDQKTVYQKTLTTSWNGTVQDDLALPNAAALGNYNIEIKSEESTSNGEFQVQEYKKPEYEVHVTAVKPHVLEGDTVQATIDARYYFGEPVAGAKVHYVIYRSRYWSPILYTADEDIEPGSNIAQSSGEENEQISEEDGQLDSDGKLPISFTTRESEHKFDNIYRVEARVTDEARREISGTGFILATYGSFLLGVEPDRYFFQPNTRTTVKVTARDYDNNPVQAKVHLDLVSWNYRDETASKSYSSTDVTTGADGTANGELQIPTEGGSYHIRATAHTPEGRDIESYWWVWVAGADEPDWYGSEQKTVQIIPDKKSYRPGETAKILIITGKPNTPVFVSVESRDLRAKQLLRSKDSTVEFDLPITADNEPGIYVSAAFIRKGELYQSAKKVKVPPEEHKLNVKLTTDKPQYLPGQTATYDVAVTGSDGKPVARTDLSLGVVDEAIYAIQPDMTLDIVSYFFGNEYNAVYTDNSLNYYFTGEAGKRRMRLADLRPKSKLAQLKPERLVQPKVRKLFPDTAFWASDLTTDAAGHTTAKVTFPDSLTTWRATARAATADTKVGSTMLKTIVRKNLILRLAVPRFFVQGDEVTLSAIVHNYLTDEKTARVSLDVEGLDILDGKTTDIKIPSRGEVRVDWRVRAKQVRNVKLTGKALTDEESDALELELPVNPPGVKLALSKGGSLVSGKNESFSLTFPQKVEPGSRSLTVHMAPSIAGSLFGALEYLTGRSEERRVG